MKLGSISILLFLILFSCNVQINSYTEAKERGIFGPVKRVTYKTYRGIRDTTSGVIVADTSALFSCFKTEYDKKGFITLKRQATDTGFKNTVTLMKGYFEKGIKIGDSTFDGSGVFREATKFKWIDKYSLSIKTFENDGSLRSDFILNLDKRLNATSSTMKSPDNSLFSLSKIYTDSNGRALLIKTSYPGQKMLPSESHYAYFDYDAYGNPQKKTGTIKSEKSKVFTITYFSYEYY
jgi:hypothetical protein